MDQVKIGRFIAECRKKANLTQMQLAEKLNITNRAVSKWETGKSMPDTSLMLDLCSVLNISVNDLLSGEVVTMDNYNKKLESNLLEMIRQKEAADKRLLSLEIVIGVSVIIIMLALTAVASLVQMEDWLRILLIVIGVIPLLFACPFMLKIEQTAGYDIAVFQLPQSKDVIDYVRERYGDELEFLWKKFPDNAVWRRKDTAKWYGAILTVSKSKLGLDSNEITEIIDLRIQPEKMEKLLLNRHYYPGWHMNKKTWYTIILDGSVKTEDIYKCIDESYRLAL